MDNDDNGPDKGPPASELIMRAIIMLVLAVVSANIILLFHGPSGH